MPPLNWFDILLMIVVVASIFSGFRTGVARVVIGLVAVVLGFLIAFWDYGMLASSLIGFVHNQAVANVLAFWLILVGIIVVGGLFGYVLTKMLKIIGLSWLNHLMGGVVGALRGVLLASVIIAATVAFAPSPSPDFLNRSAVLPYMNQLSGLLTDAVPKEAKDKFDAQMNSIKRFWSPQQQKQAKEI